MKGDWSSSLMCAGTTAACVLIFVGTLWIADRITDTCRDEVRRQLAEAMRPDDYLTMRAAANVASVAPRTVRRWIRSGRLRGVGAGRLLRVPQADLETLLHGGRRGDLTNAEIDRMVDELD